MRTLDTMILRAAWLSLVPRQFSTGGKTRLGKITKAANKEIHNLLVLGATSMVHRAPKWNSAVGVWARRLLERRPVRLVTVALATLKEVYQAKGPIASVARGSYERMVGVGASLIDPAGKRLNSVMGKAVVKDSSGNTGRTPVPRARHADWCLTRKRTPMMASGLSRVTGRT